MTSSPVIIINPFSSDNFYTTENEQEITENIIITYPKQDDNNEQSSNKLNINLEHYEQLNKQCDEIIVKINKRKSKKIKKN